MREVMVRAVSRGESGVWAWVVSNAMGGGAFPRPWRPHIGWRRGVCKRGYMTATRRALPRLGRATHWLGHASVEPRFCLPGGWVRARGAGSGLPSPGNPPCLRMVPLRYRWDSAARRGNRRNRGVSGSSRFVPREIVACAARNPQADGISQTSRLVQQENVTREVRNPRADRISQASRSVRQEKVARVVRNLRAGRISQTSRFVWPEIVARVVRNPRGRNLANVSFRRTGDEVARVGILQAGADAGAPRRRRQKARPPDFQSRRQGGRRKTPGPDQCQGGRSGV